VGPVATADNDLLELLWPDTDSSLEQAVMFLDGFEIDYRKPEVINLMNKLEALNTEMAEEVNQAEVVLLDAKEARELKIMEGMGKLDEV
jgi:hypothetical protein